MQKILICSNDAKQNFPRVRPRKEYVHRKTQLHDKPSERLTCHLRGRKRNSFICGFKQQESKTLKTYITTMRHWQQNGIIADDNLFNIGHRSIDRPK
mmetsp:Transcript_8337/g.12346  ORF Transcript_8337/g.12346 Transcript_8337/m.12346 type:complete len:97 (-) Transcript_8337:237-527(-)